MATQYPSRKRERWQNAVGEIFKRMRVANGDSPESFCDKVEPITNPQSMTVLTYTPCERGLAQPYINYLRVAEEMVRITGAKFLPEDDPRRQGYEALKQALSPHAPEGNAKIAARLTALFS